MAHLVIVVTRCAILGVDLGSKISVEIIEFYSVLPLKAANIAIE